MTIRSLLKSKGYEFDVENQYWIREWTANGGQETFLEVAMKTEDGEWNKLMMSPEGKVFYAEAVGGGV
ncbi:hypothetical protein [Prochlorococcus sp. MIT 1307]|uniref:hypothetical protein n=1 Tax=Prochlorococcus sp. MIT 1307 TaxID=3096219 RepID=UPI002A75887B|nr:hypothetical protein [Prochlorococcus sp. MIT 1307]